MNCRGCSKPFAPRNGMQRYCSPECSDDATKRNSRTRTRKEFSATRVTMAPEEEAKAIRRAVMRLRSGIGRGPLEKAVGGRIARLAFEAWTDLGRPLDETLADVRAVQR